MKVIRNNNNDDTEQQRADVADAANAADVAVVGGGLTGFAASLYLAQAGKKVILFERAASLGGYAASQERHGFTFNLGAHAIYTKSPGAEVLSELGITYTGGTPSGFRVVSGGMNYLAPVSPSSFFSSRLLTLGEKLETARLFTGLTMSRPEEYAGVTLKEWLDRRKPSDTVRRLVESSARVAAYTNAPDRISMDVVMEQLQQTAKGKVIYVDGGWQTLVDGMARAAHSAGVRIVTGARVEKVEFHEGRVSEMRLAGGDRYEVGAVILAMGLREAAKLAPDASALHGWAGDATPVHAACLDVALRRLPNNENRVVVNMDRPLFLTVQSEYSKVAPDGQTLLYALKHLDPSIPHDPSADRAELESWLDATQPGWRDEIVEQRFLPDLLVSNYLVTARAGGKAGRPGPEVPGVRNLYVAGDWVGPRGILSSAGLWSAKLAARKVTESATPARVGAQVAA